MDLMSNRKTGPGQLMIKAVEDIRVVKPNKIVKLYLMICLVVFSCT